MSGAFIVKVRNLTRYMECINQQHSQPGGGGNAVH